MAAGGKAALARALTGIEAAADRPDTAALLDAAIDAPRAHLIGLTGPPGVGKSTLTDALIRAFRARGRLVGVVAVDPTSRRTGGALLGDRTRITRDPGDDGVFIRSMAARDRLGGLATLTFPAAALMGAVMDVVLIETVGVGQSETEVADVADTVVFCAQPGSGDALQFMKAGVIEIPDIVLVTKADLGQLARQTASDMAGALSLAGPEGRSVSVLSCSALTGEGIDAAADTLLGCAVPGQAGLAQRRAERLRQARLWTDARIRADFGQFGLSHAATMREHVPESGPFREAARLSEKLRGLFVAGPS
ncbi:MAG: methylmalonyl Co-A mutase-associated GTPase MeaB [Pseudomonadota bacterium]